MSKKSTHQSSPKVLAGVPENVTHVPRLTIKKLAKQLEKIEKEYGYETTLLGVERLDYVEICRLVEQKHADNDPLLMPSRFMLLYGATDKGLKDKGNLDKFPHKLHKDCSTEISVENLSKFLSDLGLNPWQNDGLDEPAGEPEEDGAPTFDPAILAGDLFGALCAYIRQAPEPLSQELKGGTHTVAKGQSLSDIAAIHGIRDWRLLWELNKGALGDNWDVIKEGVSLKLPDTTKDPLVAWFKENQWEEYLTDKGYQYPGKYLSLTLLGANDEVLQFKEPARCQIYRYAPTPLLLHDIELEAGDDLDVLVPDTEHLALWIDGVAIGFNGRRWPSYDEFLMESPEAVAMAGHQRNQRDLPSRTEQDDSDDDENEGVSHAIPTLPDVDGLADRAMGLAKSVPTSLKSP